MYDVSHIQQAFKMDDVWVQRLFSLMIGFGVGAIFSLSSHSKDATKVELYTKSQLTFKPLVRPGQNTAVTKEAIGSLTRLRAFLDARIKALNEEPESKLCVTAYMENQEPGEEYFRDNEGDYFAEDPDGKPKGVPCKTRHDGGNIDRATELLAGTFDVASPHSQANQTTDPNNGSKEGTANASLHADAITDPKNGKDCLGENNLEWLESLARRFPTEAESKYAASVPSQDPTISNEVSGASTPRAHRSLSTAAYFPERQASFASSSLEDIQKNFEDKEMEFEYANGSASNFSMATDNSANTMSAFSTITTESGVILKDQKYAVCVVMLNEVAFLSQFMRDRSKGPRLALHMLKKKTEEFLKKWRREIPRAYHVVFYFDKKSPRRSNPDNISLSQVQHFLFGAQMLEQDKIAKVTVVKETYPAEASKMLKNFLWAGLQDDNCAGIVVVGSSWVEPRNRVDVAVQSTLRMLKAKNKIAATRVGVVQNMDPVERDLWGFHNGRTRDFWSEIFVSESRSVKEKERKAEICPRRRAGNFCSNINCPLSHGKLLA